MKLCLYFSTRLQAVETTFLKRDELTGDWRKLYSEEIHGSYSSSSIIRAIKSRRMRWAGQVASMREMRYSYRFLVGTS
jgi:hypothetical protein